MTVGSNYVIATLSDWLKRLAPVFQAMRSKTETNRTTYAWLFPRFERVTGNCYELWLVHGAVCSCCDWSEWLLWFWLKTALTKTFGFSYWSHYFRHGRSKYNQGKMLRKWTSWILIPDITNREGGMALKMVVTMRTATGPVSSARTNRIWAWLTMTSYDNLGCASLFTDKQFSRVSRQILSAWLAMEVAWTLYRST